MSSNRVTLTDGSGRWFSQKKAELFNEATYHDGRNSISKATGSQFKHEALYRTKGGRFILNQYADIQGSRESYEEISNVEAAIWFSVNESDPHTACEKEFNELEIE